MSNHKKKTHPQAKNYSADGIAFRITLGVILIALGVLVGMACFIGKQEGIFKTIGDFTRGLCGALSYGIPVLRTDENGSITVKAGGNKNHG